jgi:cytosine/uracil/thiamine/allantoin permease
MIGILIRDYWFIPRHKLKFPDLYTNKGIYWFNFGSN